VPITEDIEGPHYPETKGLARDLARALQALPAHYRQVLLLRDYEGLSVDEIAAQLGLTRESAKARLHRARGLAREYLDP
jgi:RNA polymerase sigma factor (sigma-70 family)